MSILNVNHLPLTVSKAHQEVRGTEDSQSGITDLHLWSEDTRPKNKSEIYLSFFLSACVSPSVSVSFPLSSYFSFPVCLTQSLTLSLPLTHELTTSLTHFTRLPSFKF
jgi:hypothetical protein